jgi:dTDP-4-dehydrorhamnose 3,5-epimerase
METASNRPSAIAGVLVLPLEMHRDERGHLTELVRTDWLPGFEVRQSHVLATRAGALRGMHVHARHEDFKVVTTGRLVLVLKDIRSGSATEGVAELHVLSGDAYEGVYIPRGVAHGILAEEDALVVVSVNLPYDGSDDFAFRWDDPELGVAWPAPPDAVSSRDEGAPSLRTLLETFEVA